MRIELETEKKEDNEYMAPVTDISSGTEKVVNPTKGMTLKQKISYFSTYYLPKILFIVGIVALLAAFLFIVNRKHTPYVNMLFINHHQTDVVDIEDTLIPLLEELGKNPRNNIEINASVNMDLQDFGTYEAKNTFDALIASRDFSLFFADEDIFDACADATYFRYLSEYLTDDEIKAYGDENILYGYDDLTGENYICGLRLTPENCDWIKNTNYESCCIGVIFSDVEDKDIKPVLRYILNYKADN